MNKIMSTIGDMITGAALLIVLAAFGVFGTAAPVAAAESAPTVTVTAPDRSYVPADTEPLYAVYVPESDVNWDTGETYSVDGDAIMALIDLGAMGAVNDGDDGFVYAKVGTVGDFEYGTVTVTAFGTRICTDGVVRCTGTEFDPWSPNL